MSVGLGYDPNRALNGSVSAAFVMPTSMLDRLGTKLWKSNTQTVRWRSSLSRFGLSWSYLTQIWNEIKPENVMPTLYSMLWSQIILHALLCMMRLRVKHEYK